MQERQRFTLKEALTHQDALRDTLRVLFNGKLEFSNQPEVKTSQTFNTVVMGHRFADFDRDQAIAYYVALRAGFIQPETAVIFTDTPATDQLNSKQTLVIEGFNDSAASQRNNNFLKGANDKSAATAFYEHFSNDFSLKKDKLTPARQAVLKHLLQINTWVKLVESGLKPDTINDLKSQLGPKLEILNQITELFYALKTTYTDSTHPQQLLDAVVSMIDEVLIIANQERVSPMQLQEGSKPQATLDTTILNYKYAQELEAARHQRAENLKRLEERAQSPQALEVITTLSDSGIKLARFDVRGLKSTSDAFSVASKQTGADIIFLIDDEYDDKQEIVGTRYIIKVPRSKAEIAQTTGLDVTILTERLNDNESLFGNGYAITQEKKAGGHEDAKGGLVASPRGIGSGLHPESTWLALIRFFDEKRYTTTEIGTVAQQLADQLGIATFTIKDNSAEKDSFLPEKTIIFSLPVEDSQRITTVEINESDIPHYLELFASDDQEKITQNRNLLLSKTQYADVDAIATKRSKRAIETLETQDIDNGLRAVTVLDKVKPSAIHNLPLETRLQLLQAIAIHPQARDSVWNPENTDFNIDPSSPPSVHTNLDSYASAKYMFDSAAKKVDTYLLQSIASAPELATNPSLATTFIDMCLFVVTSDEYVKNHTKKTRDTIVNTLLKTVLAAPLNEEYKNQTIQTVMDTFPAEHPIWSSLETTTLTALKEYNEPEIASFFTEVFETVGPNIELDVLVASREDLQAKQSLTCILHLGKVVPAADIVSKNSHLMDTISPLSANGPAAYVRLEKPFNSQNDEMSTITNEYLKAIQTVAKLNPDTNIPIRIMTISSSGMLSTMINIRLMASFPPELRSRLVFSSYDMVSKGYIDYTYDQLAGTTTI